MKTFLLIITFFVFLSKSLFFKTVYREFNSPDECESGGKESYVKYISQNSGFECFDTMYFCDMTGFTQENTECYMSKYECDCYDRRNIEYENESGGCTCSTCKCNSTNTYKKNQCYSSTVNGKTSYFKFGECVNATVDTAIIICIIYAIILACTFIILVAIFSVFVVLVRKKWRSKEILKSLKGKNYLKVCNNCFPKIVVLLSIIDLFPLFCAGLVMTFVFFIISVALYSSGNYAVWPWVVWIIILAVLIAGVFIVSISCFACCNFCYFFRVADLTKDGNFFNDDEEKKSLTKDPYSTKENKDFILPLSNHNYNTDSISPANYQTNTNIPFDYIYPKEVNYPQPANENTYY